MKTQFYAAASLDGFIATNDHNLDWLLQFGSTDETSYPAFIQEVGALVMGSHTYEWLQNHLKGEPWPYTQPAWVLTRRKLPPIEGANIRFAGGDVRAVYAQMAQAANGKNLWIVGGGELAAQFYDAGLLDELIVQITPVTLGGGKPFFPRRVIKPSFKLLASKVYGQFVEICYGVEK